MVSGGEPVRVSGSKKPLGVERRRSAAGSGGDDGVRGGRRMGGGIRSEVIWGLLTRVTWGDIRPFIEGALNEVAHPNHAKEILEYLGSCRGEMPLGSFIFDVLVMRQLDCEFAKIAFKQSEAALGKVKDLEDENLSLSKGYFRAKRVEDLELVRDAR